jgi:hypothetical protein
MAPAKSLLRHYHQTGKNALSNRVGAAFATLLTSMSKARIE